MSKEIDRSSESVTSPWMEELASATATVGAPWQLNEISPIRLDTPFVAEQLELLTEASLRREPYGDVDGELFAEQFPSELQFADVVADEESTSPSGWALEIPPGQRRYSWFGFVTERLRNNATFRAPASQQPS